MENTELEMLSEAELLPAREALSHHGGFSFTLAWVSASNSAVAVNALTLGSIAAASANQTIIIG